MRINDLSTIHIYLPEHLSIERYDEFGILSSHYEFDVLHLIYCAFKETDGSLNTLFPGFM